MTRVSMAGLALLAAFALAAFASATAFAAENPTLLDSRGEAVSTVVTSKAETSELQLSGGGTKIECSTELDSDTVATSKTGDGKTSGTATVTFKGCKTAAGKCQNTAATGEITGTVATLLVWVGKETEKKPGTLVSILPLSTKPGNGKGGLLSFTCSGSKVNVEGSFIALTSRSLYEEFTTATLLARQSGGAQEDKKYTENGKEGTNTLFASSAGAAFVEAGEGIESEEAYKQKVKILENGTEADVGFDTESGWSAEGVGGGTFMLTEEAAVSCAKEKFKGVAPTSGFSSTSDLAPEYSECQLELTKGGAKTKATVTSNGCDFEYLNSEEPGKDKFDSELDISKCSGSGIVITDSELEAGKTCEVTIPDQALGKEDTGEDSKEAAPFESGGEIDATDVKAENKECPKAIEEGKAPGGKSPGGFFFIFMFVGSMVFFGFIWFF
jgi:hypothetical protein